MSELTIRAARVEDAAVMLALHREAILSRAASYYPRATLEAWGTGPTAERTARQERQIAEGDVVTLVAERDGELIGFGIAVPSEQRLRALYVKPNAIGRVGSRLLAALEERAFATAEFLACDASLNAVRFYEVHGYTAIGAVEHVLSSGVSVPCLRMRKARPTETLP